MDIRIVLVDDHNLVRQAISSLIREQEGMQVVAEADGGHAAVSAAEKTRPDLVITEVAMPDLSGAETARKILAAVPSTKVLVLSTHHEEYWVTQMLEAGASGYVPKTCVVAELVMAIKAVTANQMYLSPGVGATLAKAYLQSGGAHNGRGAAQALTSRQRGILKLMADGLSTAEIAERLDLGVATVGGHRRRMMAKLGVHGTADLIRYAVRTGLVSLEQKR